MGFHSWTGPLRDMEDSNLWGRGSEGAQRRLPGTLEAPPGPGGGGVPTESLAGRSPGRPFSPTAWNTLQLPWPQQNPRLQGNRVPYKENSSTFFVPCCPHPW